jgi:hypothetical protein
MTANRALTTNQLDQTHFSMVKNDAVYTGALISAIFNALPGAKVAYEFSPIEARWKIVDKRTKATCAVQIEFPK